MRFSPAWELLCLQAYLRSRTGHTCEFIDVRLSASTEEALTRLDSPSHRHQPQVAVIYAALHSIGYAVQIASLIRERRANMTLVMCGPFPSAYPEHLVKMHHFDFALCGDAEPILRNLMEFSDVEQRLRQIPGLYIGGSSNVPSPRWENDIHRFTLRDWDGSIWSKYETGLHADGARIEIRLSRGTPGTEADRAFPGGREPLRVLSLEEMASLVHKCPGHGIREVFLADPPGFWTPKRIIEWCGHLDQCRNSQPWAMQMIPRAMNQEEINKLAFRGCRRIELIIPTFDRGIQDHFGYTMTDSELDKLVTALTRGGITPQFIYWIQGPGNNKGEAERILKHIQNTHVLEFSVYPFPLNPDSELYRERAQQESSPRVNEWVTWALDMDRNPQPPGLWTGQEGVKNGGATIATVTRKMIRNPWLRMMRLVKKQRARLMTRMKSTRSPFHVTNSEPRL